MKVFTLDTEGLTANANIVKETLLRALEEANLLRRPAEEVSADFAVICSAPNVLGRLWAKARGWDSGEKLYYAVLQSAARRASTPPKPKGPSNRLVSDNGKIRLVPDPEPADLEK